MTYPKAIEALRGHPDWWRYEYHGRTNEQVQAEAIRLAKVWVKPGPGEQVEAIVPCCPDPPLPP